MGYQHLSIDEREVILKMKENCKTIEEIAERIGRNRTTVWRELQKNTSSNGQYKAHLAQKYYCRRRSDAKQPYRLDNEMLKKYVIAKIEQDWSPEQIANRLKRNHPNKNKMWISTGTIYHHIYQDKAQGGKLYKHLRHGLRKRRKRHGSTEKRGQIPNKRIIDQRPKVVETRKRIGDWESDSVVGRNHKSHIATHVERKSRFILSAKLESKSADDYNAATIRLFKKIPDSRIKTMTVDNGKEFAGFKQLEKQLNTKVYFAHPYCSYERGTNENANGLLRQYFPKGTDFNLVSQKEIDNAVERLNNRPRKCLNYRTPTEVFN